MSKIENLTAALCDELMIEASSGRVDHIENAISMLIEYSSFELARHGESEAAAALIDTAKRFQESFPQSRAVGTSSELALEC